MLCLFVWPVLFCIGVYVGFVLFCCVCVAWIGSCLLSGFCCIVCAVFIWFVWRVVFGCAFVAFVLGCCVGLRCVV